MGAQISAQSVEEKVTQQPFARPNPAQKEQQKKEEISHTNPKHGLKEEARAKEREVTFSKAKAQEDLEVLTH